MTAGRRIGLRSLAATKKKKKKSTEFFSLERTNFKMTSSSIFSVTGISRERRKKKNFGKSTRKTPPSRGPPRMKVLGCLVVVCLVVASLVASVDARLEPRKPVRAPPLCFSLFFSCFVGGFCKRS
jgi:hypothetical protein